MTPRYLMTLTPEEREPFLEAAVENALSLYEADRVRPEAERELTADLETGDFHDYDSTIGEAMNGTTEVFPNGFTAYVHAADEGGYWAEVPALPGCLTQGETLDEVVENLNDAIQGWLSVQTEDALRALGVSAPDAPSAAAASRFPRVRTLELAA